MFGTQRPRKNVFVFNNFVTLYYVYAVWVTGDAVCSLLAVVLNLCSAVSDCLISVSQL